MKRKSADDESTVVTPRKTHTTPARSRRGQEVDEGENDVGATPTPSKRKRVATVQEDVEMTTPAKIKTPSKSVFETATKPALVEDDEDGAPLLRNPERSARRKSARHLLQRTAGSNISDEEAIEEEDELAERILSEDEARNISAADEEDVEEEDGAQDGLLPQTPSKGSRGRPKGRRKQRTPTPPRDLPPYEQYFFQNRPGAVKTSNNTLAGLSLLTHEEYFDIMQTWTDPHEAEIQFLHDLHSRSFDNWIFELERGFNLCLYGWGSKRQLLLSFAAHLAEQQTGTTILVVNGYNAGTTIRTILTTLASAIPALASSNQKLGAQPADMLNTILATISAKPPTTPYTILVHSLDSQNLRRPATQTLLARLASSPHIRLIASCDTPNFPLLWDANLCAQFKWLYHDATTFRPMDTEIAAGGTGGGVVDEVNALLGRSGRKMQGREGVMYVLRSLTDSARSLYALLITELLSLEDVDLDDGAAQGGDEDDFHEMMTTSPRKGGKARGGMSIRAAGIDFRSLYQKSASQFIATNESTFRGLLREFYDHEMLVSRKDGLGGEVFGVPFRKEEMEAILAELAV